MPKLLALDLHRDYVHRCRLERRLEGAQMKHSRFLNTRDAWSRFIADEVDRDTWVVYEVTGNAFEVHDLLSPHAGKVLPVKPSAARERGTRRKTDRADMERLVIRLADGTVQPVWVPPAPVRAVRRLLQVRARTDSRRRATQNQMRAVLRRNWVLVPAGRDVLGWLTEHPEALARLPEVDAVLVLSLGRQMRVLGEEVAALGAEVAARVAHEPGVQALLTIPGVSLLTAATIWAWIGDPHRFRGPKQVARYAGLDPALHCSGQVHRHGGISKNGSRTLRTALIEAAHSVARWDTGPLGSWFQRLRRRNVGYHRAVVALARKLLIVAWRILQTGAPYRGARTDTTRRKERTIARQAAAARDWRELALELLGVAPATVPGLLGPHDTQPEEVKPPSTGPHRLRTPVPA